MFASKVVRKKRAGLTPRTPAITTEASASTGTGRMITSAPIALFASRCEAMARASLETIRLTIGTPSRRPSA